LGKLLFSEATFQELQTVLNRSKFDKYVSLTIRSEFMFRLKLESELIEIIEQVNLCRDLKDNQFLEVAMNGNADYLITGDQDLLVLRPFQEIQIMTVHEFLSEQ
ncbi:MAG: putative toxin-antitoxin system toxin component, PIN family, partial [Microcystaceae cyanobacterium]